MFGAPTNAKFGCSVLGFIDANCGGSRILSERLEKFAKHSTMAQTTHMRQMTPTMTPTLESTMCLDLGFQC